MVHPNVSGIYRKKVERLTEALDTPEDRNEAADAIRALVEKITQRPGPNRGEIDATLHGDWARSSDGSTHKPLERLGNAKLPRLSLREYRYRWLRGPATDAPADLHRS
jgi:site-specific DNA recombinase